MSSKRKAATPEKPIKKPTKSKSDTQLSLCVPSSLISATNAYSLEQITHIAYQIARSATLYNVAEVVVLDIPSREEKATIAEKKANKRVELGSDKGGKKIKFNIADEELAPVKPQEEEAEAPSLKPANDSNALLFALLLQYFVTPPYLVKSVFEAQFLPKFKHAHKLPKLSSLPFMNNNGVDHAIKEGLTIAKASPQISKKAKAKAAKKLAVTRYVNVGGAQALELQHDVPVNVRVTVDTVNKKVVSPVEAYGTAGAKASFGYHVRYAKSFSALFTESAYPEGYTAAVHVDADNYFGKAPSIKPIGDVNGKVLLVVGNIKDLAFSFENDKSALQGVANVEEMFDGQLAVPLGARIEDAALIALTRIYRV